MKQVINEYRKILEKKGISFQNCVVLHFRFNKNHHSFHFALMGKGLSGHLLDFYEDGNVFVVISKNDSRIEMIKQLAVSMGSECNEIAAE